MFELWSLYYEMLWYLKWIPSPSRLLDYYQIFHWKSSMKIFQYGSGTIKPKVGHILTRMEQRFLLLPLKWLLQTEYEVECYVISTAMFTQVCLWVEIKTILPIDLEFYENRKWKHLVMWFNWIGSCGSIGCVLNNACTKVNRFSWIGNLRRSLISYLAYLVTYLQVSYRI